MEYAIHLELDNHPLYSFASNLGCQITAIMISNNNF